MSLIDDILKSPEWMRACRWGEPRPGHPEGTIGHHVFEQLMPFIDLYYQLLPDYEDENLQALALLHDIGKPDTQYQGGHLVGDSHSVISARIAAKLGAPDRLVQVILSNDRAYSHWRRLENKYHQWTATRWTEERRAKFVEEFGRPGLDLNLLVLFHRADNAYRRPEQADESLDSVLWFENRLLSEGLLVHLPREGKDKRLDWADELA